MNKYLTRVSQVYSSKNKLEAAIQEFIKSNDRLIIDGKDLNEFKWKIIQHINFLNLENARCTPKCASWYKAGESSKLKDWGISGVDCVAFYIYEIKNEYNSKIE